MKNLEKGACGSICKHGRLQAPDCRRCMYRFTRPKPTPKLEKPHRTWAERCQDSALVNPDKKKDDNGPE